MAGEQRNGPQGGRLPRPPTGTTTCARRGVAATSVFTLRAPRRRRAPRQPAGSHRSAARRAPIGGRRAPPRRPPLGALRPPPPPLRPPRAESGGRGAASAARLGGEGDRGRPEPYRTRGPRAPPPAPSLKGHPGGERERGAAPRLRACPRGVAGGGRTAARALPGCRRGPPPARHRSAEPRRRAGAVAARAARFLPVCCTVAARRAPSSSPPPVPPRLTGADEEVELVGGPLVQGGRHVDASAATSRCPPGARGGGRRVAAAGSAAGGRQGRAGRAGGAGTAAALPAGRRGARDPSAAGPRQEVPRRHSPPPQRGAARGRGKAPGPRGRPPPAGREAAPPAARCRRGRADAGCRDAAPTARSSACRARTGTPAAARFRPSLDDAGGEPPLCARSSDCPRPGGRGERPRLRAAACRPVLASPRRMGAARVGSVQNKSPQLLRSAPRILLMPPYSFRRSHGILGAQFHDRIPPPPYTHTGGAPFSAPHAQAAQRSLLLATRSR